MHIALCAGEPSGDALGADLIQALKLIYPDAVFSGIAGPRMQAQGCESLFPMETLSVMGVAEVLPKLPAILSIRHHLIKHFRHNPPDVFIGIDSPDFNLPVEKALKRRGIKTVHYVSPTVWAWREKRVLGIKKSTDLMLCVFPFEPPVYEKYGMKAQFIGHPAAERLGGATMEYPHNDEITIALLPGSRKMEITHLAPIFFNVAHWLDEKYPNIRFVLPAVNERIFNQLFEIYQQLGLKISLNVSIGNSEACMKMADVVLCTSGTTTLEAMILNKPMVVAYKMSGFNWWLAQWLVNVKYIALPNLLADKKIVPEFVQNDANIYNLTQAVDQWLSNPERATHCRTLYEPYCKILAQNASQQAALAIKDLLWQRTLPPNASSV